MVPFLLDGHLTYGFLLGKAFEISMTSFNLDLIENTVNPVTIYAPTSAWMSKYRKPVH
jgi:hypothetical protein